jgi:hypothetical protein
LGDGHIDRASLAAVCDPIRARADAVASKSGVPSIYDINDFLARKDVDAVAVLTPSGMHPERCHRLCESRQARDRRKTDGVSLSGGFQSGTYPIGLSGRGCCFAFGNC